MPRAIPSADDAHEAVLARGLGPGGALHGLLGLIS